LDAATQTGSEGRIYAHAEEEDYCTLMVIKQLYRVERREYENWILNVIDDDKLFVRSIGNIQEHLKCHCGAKVCGKCPFR